MYVFSVWHLPTACAKRTGAAASVAAGDVSASPEQGEACELAGVTRAWQTRRFERMRTHKSIWRKYGAFGGGDGSVASLLKVVITVSCANRIGNAASAYAAAPGL